MLTGKSILHVKQGIGKAFAPGKVEGYFNDFSEKVLREPNLLENDRLPKMPLEQGNVDFPVGIFQYGLGAYDLFLLTQDKKYQRKFFQCAEWALEKQEVSGAWNNFFFSFPDHPYGAMCQGEGASLLLRAYLETKDDRYLAAAHSALEFMLCPISEGGTTAYESGKTCFMEFTHLPAVYNGWIFAYIGLYEYLLICPNEEWKCILDSSFDSLKRNLVSFDRGYWSNYDANGKIASPFYHDLHIAQLQALFLMSNDSDIESYMYLFEKYRKSIWNKCRAFVIKAIQKLFD